MKSIKTKGILVKLLIASSFVFSAATYCNVNTVATSAITSSLPAILAQKLPLPSIISFTPQSITLKQNVQYELPKKLIVTLSNNTKKSMSVKWASKTIYVNTKQTGMRYYYGSIISTGYSKQIKLSIKVIPYVVSIANLNITLMQFDSYTFPKTIPAKFSDGSMKDISVKWKETSVDSEKAGKFFIEGSYEGYNKSFLINFEILPTKIVSAVASRENVMVVIPNSVGNPISKNDFSLSYVALAPVDENIPLEITGFATQIINNNDTKIVLSFKKLVPGFEDKSFQIRVTYRGVTNIDSNIIKIPKLISSTDNYDPKIWDKQQFYNAIKYALENFNDSIDLNIKNYSEKEYNLDMIDKVLYENPEIDYSYYYASSSIGYPDQYGYSNYSLKLKYKLTKEKMLTEKKAVEQKADEIVARLVVPGMSDYQKELVLHDYIVASAEYDNRASSNLEPAESHNSYGVLLLGVGVCESYAKAMSILFDKAGLENRYVVGSANDGSGPVGHAWNMVMLDGEWYNVDSTWDDPVTAEADSTSRIRHEYFNVTDRMISQDHKADETLIDYPDCTGTKYYFFSVKSPELDKKGNKMIYVSTVAEYISALSTALSTRQPYVGFVLLNSTIQNYDTNSALDSADRSVSFRAGYTESTSPIDANIRFVEIQLSY